MSARYLLDTNHLGAALRDVGGVRKRILSARKSSTRVGTCMPVICELEAGLQKTRDLELNWKILRQILTEVKIWPIDYAIAREYGLLYRQLRSKGRVLSQFDMLQAAMARIMRATLVTTDRDFEAVDGLRTENWLELPTQP